MNIAELYLKWTIGVILKLKGQSEYKYYLWFFTENKNSGGTILFLYIIISRFASLQVLWIVIHNHKL